MAFNGKTLFCLPKRVFDFRRNHGISMCKILHLFTTVDLPGNNGQHCIRLRISIKLDICTNSTTCD